MKNKIIAIFFSLVGTICFCSPVNSVLGADGMEIISDDMPKTTYIEDGLVWMWSQNDGEPLDQYELTEKLIEMYNGGDFTIDVAYVNADISLDGDTIYVRTTDGKNGIFIQPRNARTIESPLPRPNMRYAGDSEFNTYYYTDSFRLGMVGTNTTITRYWGDHNQIKSVSRETPAASSQINTNAIRNKFGCILIYNRALSEEEMQYNYMTHKLEFGNDN